MSRIHIICFLPHASSRCNLFIGLALKLFIPPITSCLTTRVSWSSKDLLHQTIALDNNILMISISFFRVGSQSNTFLLPKNNSSALK